MAFPDFGPQELVFWPQVTRDWYVKTFEEFTGSTLQFRLKEDLFGEIGAKVLEL